ncbi:MAG: hypothetical protein ACRCY9_01755 [Phycicoccus sp.]
MRRRATSRPVFGLFVLLVAVAVVAMHQLGAGHGTPDSLLGHHAAPVTAGEHGAGLGAGTNSSQTADADGHVCSPGCVVAGVPAGESDGHTMTMTCLAVLPLLVLLLLIRRGLRTSEAGWRDHHPLFLFAHHAGAVRVLAPDPPRTLLTRLCVSLT